MYWLVNNIHVATAVLTAAFFLLRLGMDAAGHPWRHTPLRWLPHVNDTILLASAITLVVITPWSLITNYWLKAKVVVLVLYILAGKQALDAERGGRARLAYGALALALLTTIFVHAVYKPG